MGMTRGVPLAVGLPVCPKQHERKWVTRSQIPENASSKRAPAGIGPKHPGVECAGAVTGRGASSIKCAP